MKTTALPYESKARPAHRRRWYRRSTAEYAFLVLWLGSSCLIALAGHRYLPREGVWLPVAGTLLCIFLGAAAAIPSDRIASWIFPHRD